MTDQTANLIAVIIAGLLGGGAVAAVISWLANRGKNKADEIQTLQDVWAQEFKRLESRIDELEKEVKGRDVSIADLKQEISRLKEENKCKDREIERLTVRIRELERLMRKFGIDPDGSGGG